MIESKKIKLIGVDLGGTKVTVGLVLGEEIVEKKYALIPQNTDDWRILADLIKNLISQIFFEYTDIKGIGIGVPSILDRDKGIIYEVQNIPSWQEVHLADILREEFDVPVFLDNDANCFALGEYYYGEGKNIDNMVGITIGTGLGAGIISRGSLLADANGGSGEFGMIPYKEGILEDYCSGKFFKKNYNKNGEELMFAAEKGSVEALRAFESFGYHLGNAIKIIMYAIDPQKVIIGGSVVKSAKFFNNSLLKSVNEFAYKKTLENFEILYSKRDDIAVLGAASLFFDRILHTPDYLVKDDNVSGK
jgi:glucokinase